MSDEKNFSLAMLELGLIPIGVILLAVYVVVFPFLFIYSMFTPTGPGDFFTNLIPGLNEFIQ